MEGLSNEEQKELNKAIIDLADYRVKQARIIAPDKSQMWLQTLKLSSGFLCSVAILYHRTNSFATTTDIVVKQGKLTDETKSYLISSMLSLILDQANYANKTAKWLKKQFEKTL